MVERAEPSTRFEETLTAGYLHVNKVEVNDGLEPFFDMVEFDKSALHITSPRI